MKTGDKLKETNHKYSWNPKIKSKISITSFKFFRSSNNLSYFHLCLFFSVRPADKSLMILGNQLDYKTKSSESFIYLEGLWDFICLLKL